MQTNGEDCKDRFISQKNLLKFMPELPVLGVLPKQRLNYQ